MRRWSIEETAMERSWKASGHRGGWRRLSVLVFALAAGCALEPAGTNGGSIARAMEPARLDGAWRLRESGGVAVPGTRAELVFTSARGELHGSDGCNRLVGRYTLEAGRLTTRTASTRMACLSEPEASTSRTLGLLLGGGAEALEVGLPDGGRGLLLRAGGEQALFERRPQR
jgi:heat shock protein HslJ